MDIATSLGPVSMEFANADLGDRRRTKRVKVIAEALSQQPAAGFPRALRSSAELEAFYRFINCPDFSAADIVAPHIDATLARAKRHKVVVAIHDTSQFEYSTERQGFGYTTNAKVANGFVAHACLLASESDAVPLGVGYLETWTRCGTKNSKRRALKKKRQVHSNDDPTRESLRWLRGVSAIEKARTAEMSIVHVTDAEGDFFEFLANLDELGARFVIRAGHTERLTLQDGQETSVREIADLLTKPVVRRKIELSYRKLKSRSNRSTATRHPSRSERTARVAIAATPITLKATAYLGTRTKPLALNLVRVWEPKPPTDEPAIEWLLLTRETIKDAADIERIVDIYRKRWVIEEYFKALKSGCSLEKRQVESYDAMAKVLALFIPIAHRILLLRSLERSNPAARATKVFSRTELTIMTHAPSNKGLPPPKSIRDALMHLARMGGHIRNNGAPGWQTLAWGYEKLLMLRLGWELAIHEKHSRKYD